MLGPGYLKAVVADFDASPLASAVLTVSMFIDGEGNEIGAYLADMDWDIRDPQPAVRLRKVLRTLGLCSPAFAAFRRDVLRTTGLVGPFDSSDIVLISENALHGEFHCLPEPMFLRRMHDGMSR